MESSPSLGVGGGTRARLLATTSCGSGSGGADRRVVFLASQPGVAGAGVAAGLPAAGHETRTWPHHWSPHTVSLDIFFYVCDKIPYVFFWGANVGL